MPADPGDWRAWIAYGLSWAGLGWDASSLDVPDATCGPVPAYPVGPDRLAALAEVEQERVVEIATSSAPWGHRATSNWETSDWGISGWGAPTAAARRLELHAYTEAAPGARWQGLFAATWPAYRSWYLSEGAAARPDLDEAAAALARHMPELVPTWERLVELTDLGDGVDETAARLLTMWRVPVFAAGCSQVVLDGPDPALIRNYDYDPQLFEGVIASTNYSGARRVIGTSDLLWGLLDGMNDAGLCLSLTYGGRPGGADGFAIPLALRYVLETCTDVDSAVATLRRLPVAQAYNLAILDASGAHATVFVAPGEPLRVSDLRATTNHRLETVEHPATARSLRSVPRQQHLLEALEQGTPRAEILDSFTRSPLRSVDYDAGFGTLYTAQYRPQAGEVTYRWPDATWTRAFDDADERRVVSLPV